MLSHFRGGVGHFGGGDLMTTESYSIHYLIGFRVPWGGWLIRIWKGIDNVYVIIEGWDWSLVMAKFALIFSQFLAFKNFYLL